MTDPTITYTYTDEAPLLATYSLLPILRAFVGAAGIALETKDISLAGRILAAFPDQLPADRQQPDDLAQLGHLVHESSANIIKLPNVSASAPQLRAAITELQGQGYAIPDYPAEPSTDEEGETRRRYDELKGSAVNPVLRQGNSDRRAPGSVKAYARSHPHSMGAWSTDSKTRVAHMSADDFRSTEQSAVIEQAGSLRIELVADGGAVTLLKPTVNVLAGEIVDAAVMRVAALDAFLTEQIARAKAEGVLLSVHLKATMMKVSDPIIFGRAVEVFFPKTFAQYGKTLASAGLHSRDGLGGILPKLADLPEGEAIAVSFASELDAGPKLAMVDSNKGITNLHVPSDVIVDASMPAMIRTSGHMWGPDGKEADTLAVIPDSSYATVYGVVVDDCRVNGALDPTTMGSVPNVGLMAQAAEEYGSHDKTFEIATTGVVKVVENGSDRVVFELRVAVGDIFRMCQTKDIPVRNWVTLAVSRARASGDPIVFWLDETRPHDANIIAKVRTYLADEDVAGLTIEIMSPAKATALSLERIRRGENTISVTGNVLRDYLTDLFPILELGTSAKMLSVVPLIEGGGLFETGAGGSAPKHVQQLVKENYLRWDSLGEFLALVPSLELMGQQSGNPRAQILADTLDRATGSVLNENRSPSRRLGGLDNRGSHFYLALYWAQELAEQDADAELAAKFAPLAKALSEQEKEIVEQLISVQGSVVELGGYYRPDPELADKAMRPSATFNAAIEEFASGPTA
jgi:isocitrate dehydrogenase